MWVVSWAFGRARRVMEKVEGRRKEELKESLVVI